MNTKYRKTVIAGNWKMNMTASEVRPFVEELKAVMPKLKGCETVLCVPAVNIPAMLRWGKDAKIACGAEDVSAFEKGAYTGEIAANMLADLGVKYCIVGHSERREYHKESDMLVNAKARALLDNGISPIICVGESLEQREMELTMAHINYQVRAALHGVDASELRRCVIAYEPIWAIGTGKTATAEQAEEVCREIRSIIREIYGARPARSVSILYGGSMNAKNAAELLAMPDIDGGLIGGASLKPADFATIIAAAGAENE
ncbi:MAG: triose-phosphate isomerase [Oscillospiraceae bacterium]|nr:triose-phosphate isomerase [Oscillospiraceae bacterium]